MKKKAAALVAFIGLSGLSACAAEPPPPAETAPIEQAPLIPESEAQGEAEAEAPPREPITISIPVEAKSKSKLTGTATFSEVEDGVLVAIALEGVTPGDHGAHVHETGDCSAADGNSAGGHFNPTTHDHALPDKEARHLGDLGNITIGKDGKGELEITVKGANLLPNDPHSYAGRAIVIHAKKDDGGQPTGNAGDRIGCGVIAP